MLPIGESKKYQNCLIRRIDYCYHSVNVILSVSVCPKVITLKRFLSRRQSGKQIGKFATLLTFSDEVLFQGEGDGRFSGAGQTGEPNGAPAKGSQPVKDLTSLRPRHLVLLIENVGRTDFGEAGSRPLKAISIAGDLHDSIS